MFKSKGLSLFSQPVTSLFFLLFSLLLVSPIEANAEIVTFIYAQRGGGDNEENGNAIAIDNNDVRFIVGEYNGETNIFGHTFVSEHRAHAFFAISPLHDQNPTLVLAFESTTNSVNDGVQAHDLAIDSNGNIVIVGEFHGSMSFLTDSVGSLGRSDIFVAKLSNDGGLLWLKRFGGGQWDTARSVAIDENNKIVVTGNIQGSFSLGTTVMSSDGQSSAFLMKLDEDGNVEWARQNTSADDSSSAISTDVATDSENSIYITGSFSKDSYFGSHHLENPTGRKAFLVKYSEAGVSLWAKQFGDRHAAGKALTVDSNDNVYLAGYFNKTAVFGEVTLTGVDNTGSDDEDAFLVKYDHQAAFSWVKHIPARYVYDLSLATDALQNVIFVVSAANAIDDSRHSHILKYTPGGSGLWTKRADGDGSTMFSDVAMDSEGRIHLTGVLRETALFDGITLTSITHPDGFIKSDVLVAVLKVLPTWDCVLPWSWLLLIVLLLLYLMWRRSKRKAKK